MNFSAMRTNLVKLCAPSTAVRRAMGNSSWMLLERVIIMGTNLLVTLILARTLGPESFGTLTYLLALLLIVGPITVMGFNSIVTREIVGSPQDEREIMSTTLFFRLAGGLVGNGLLIGWAWFFSDFTPSELQIISIIMLCNVAHAFQVVEFYFQSIVSIHFVSMMRSASVIIFAAIKIAVATLTHDLWNVAIVFGIEFVVLAGGYWLLYQHKGQGLSLKSFNFRYGVQLFRHSFWLVLSGLSSVLYLKIDQVMIGNMVGFAEVGTYAVAVRISEVWYFLAEAIVISFFSLLVKLRVDSLAQYNQSLQRLCDGLFISALLLAIVISIIATPLITILFGESYTGAATILTIHIWAGVFVFMRALASKWLVAENILQFSLLSDGIGAAINITANYFLIERYGGIGAAWATVISYSIASYFAYWISKKTRPMARIMTSSLCLPFTGFKRYRNTSRSR